MILTSAWVKICQISHVNFERTSQFLSKFCIILQSPVNFKLTHFLVWIKGSHQCPNFETFECSAPNSSCHLPNHKSVFLKILHHSSVSWKITFLYFFSSNNIYCAQKEVKSFETFECLGQNLSNSSFQS